MASTAAQVDSGVSGIISVAPLGTALPTAVGTVLNVAFVDVGYISPDGVKETQPTASTPVIAWGGDRVRDNQTEHALEFDFTMLETSTVTLTQFYGDAATIKGAPLPHQAWVIDWKDGTKTRRYCIPDACIISRQEVTIAGNTAIQYGVKLSCYPNAAGIKAFRYQSV